MSNKDFVKGAIYGHIIGEAVGFPLKNISVAPKHFDMYGTSTYAKGSYGDASSMMLCTIAAINDSRSISVEDIMDSLQNWYIGGYLTLQGDCIEIKTNVSQALTNYTNGFPPDRCGINEESQNNNAALIRTLPIALFCSYKSIDDFVENIHQAAKITNPQLDNQVCCVLYGLLVRNILLEKKEKIFELLEDYYKTKKQKDNVAILKNILAWRNSNSMKGTENVIDSFWSSWSAFSNCQDNFSGCLENAVKFGNSCDDTCSLAGALSGLRVGFNNLPEEWVSSLQLSFEVSDEIDKFVALLKN